METEKKRSRWEWIPFLLAMLSSFVCVFSATALALMAQPNRLDDASMLPVGTADYGVLAAAKFQPLDAAIFADATQDAAGLHVTPGSSGELPGSHKTPVYIAFMTPAPTSTPVPPPVVVTMTVPGTAVPHQPATATPRPTRKTAVTPSAQPTNRPTSSPTMTATPLPAVTPTSTPVWPTATAAATAVSLTSTFTPAPTNPPPPNPTATPSPTGTAVPSYTPIPSTPTNTATGTAVPPTPTNTATKTAVPPTPTNTPTATPTATPPLIHGVSVALVNADTETVIPGYETMPDGIILDLAALPTENLNIWVTLDPQYGDRVDVFFNGSLHHTEYYYPYTFPGNTYDPSHPNHPYNDFWAYNFALGNYTLIFQPYAINNTPGIPFVFNFTVIRSTARLNVTPVMTCIFDLGSGNYLAMFGYDNPNSFIVNIPLGTENQFQPDPADRGQPVSFFPGQSPNVLAASFTAGGSVSWLLDGSTAVADSSSPLCP